MDGKPNDASSGENLSARGRVTFNLIRRVRRWGISDLAPEAQLIIVALAIGPIVAFFSNEHSGIVAYLFLAFYLFIVFIFWGPVAWLSKSMVVGQLNVSAYGVESRQGETMEKVRFEDISRARFVHDHIEGERFHLRDIEHSGIAQLILSLRDGRELTYTMIVERWEQVPQVQLMLRTLYSNQVDLQEIMGRQKLRTILFKHGRSFKEIQALKEELGVDGFY